MRCILEIINNIVFYLGEYYQQVTSFTRAALLLGRFLSGVVSQTLVGLGWCDFRDLNYISLAMVSVATLVTFFLPSVKNTIYFHTGCHFNVFNVRLHTVLAKQLETPSFRYPVFTKEINTAVWSALGKYRVTKTGYFQLFGFNCI